MSRLQMTAGENVGSFVRELQGVTGVGFAEGTHVHKDWWAKTISYEQALDLAEDAARLREDIMAKAEDIKPQLNDDGKFVFNVGSREFTPTDHALEQFAIRAGVPSSSIMRELRAMEGSDEQDHSTMVKLAQNALRKLKADKVFRLRTYTDGTCRAFLTDKYAPVDNRWYLEVLREFLPSARLSHWRGDEDSLYGNLILPDSVIDYGQSDDSDYGGMLSVGNCEIGTRTVSQRPSLFRSICMNGCIWGQVSGKRIKRRHSGTIHLESLKQEIAENIEFQLPLLDDGIRIFLALRENTIPQGISVRAVIGVICQDYRIGKTEANEIVRQWAQYEAESTNLFGVINSLTRAGQKFDNKTWVAFDELAGKLVNMTTNQWESVCSRARAFVEENFVTVFGDGQ